MIDQRAILAENIKAFRTANRLNQNEFAEECGISKDTVSLIERCKLNTTIDTLDLLAARMDTRISDLLKSSEDVIFILISQEITIEDNTGTTYGIGVVKDNELIEQIHDITLNYDKAKEIVTYCNQSGFSINKLEELAEDVCD